MANSHLNHEKANQEKNIVLSCCGKLQGVEQVWLSKILVSKLNVSKQ
jgi:hypothetical protein